MISRLISWVFCALFLIAFNPVCLGIYLFFGYSLYSAEQDNTLKKLDEFMEAIQLIKSDYVDGDRLTNEELINGAIDGMVKSLDRYGAFIEKSDINDFNENMDRVYPGIGISYGIVDNKVFIKRVTKDSPAFQAGVKVNDQIVSIDGKDIVVENNRITNVAITGEVNSSVKLGLRRQDVSEIIEVEMTRKNIREPRVVDLHMIGESGVAYVRLLSFSSGVEDDFEEQLKSLFADEKSVVKGLIVDLRGNPGGNVISVSKICSYFLPDKELIVEMEVRKGKTGNKLFSDSKYKIPSELPVVLLINSDSASASEIMASCLRDYNRGVLVGEKSFGKGIAQQNHILSTGNALYFTVSRWYTKKRVEYHGVGVKPDVEDKMNKKELYNLFNLFDYAKRDSEDSNIRMALKLLQSGAVVPGKEFVNPFAVAEDNKTQGAEKK